jgi:hypothetical protein
MTTELCTITCANVQFRVQRQEVELESRYISWSTNRYLKFGNGSAATRKFKYTGHTCWERMEGERTKLCSASELEF